MHEIFLIVSFLGAHRHPPTLSSARGPSPSDSAPISEVRVCFLSNGCKIRVVSDGPELIASTPARERNWMPLVIASAAVVVIAAVVILVMERGAGRSSVAPVNAAADPYAGSLPISNLQMSESSNLAGGKVTYLDGHIANKGDRIVTGVSVQV